MYYYVIYIMNPSPLNVVVFGMSLRVLNDLKSTILDIMPRHVEVNWANIASPKIDILMINVDFFDVPSIQKIIQNNHIKVLKVLTNNHKQGIIEKNILNLPLHDNISPLKNWLLEIIDGQDTLEYQSIIHAEKKTEIVNKAVTLKHQQSIVEIVKEIQNPRNGKIQIFDARGILALADPRNEWVWSKIQDYNVLRTDLSLNYTYAKLSESDSYSKEFERADLKNWLWNLLWQSPSISISEVKESEHYLIDFWPQPIGETDRRDILRITACFSQGASIRQVAQHLSLSDERVKQFMVAAVSVGFAHRINASDSKFNPNKAVTGNQGFMKKLFGGLRKRLGI